MTYFIRFRDEGVDLAVSEGRRPGSHWLDQGYSQVDQEDFMIAWRARDKMAMRRLRLLAHPPEPAPIIMPLM